MTDPTTQRRQRLAPEARAQQILDVAAKLLLDEGFTEVSMERLGREAGISKALVYNYFPNRNDLLRALLEREMAVLRESQAAAVAQAKDFRDLLRQTTRIYIEHVHARGSLLRKLWAEPAVARAVADSYGLPRDFFFMPNQLSKHKNHLLVLDALSELSARGRQVVVVSSGKQEDERHPDYFPSVMSRRQALKQEEHFRLLGMIPYPHVRALMRTATALLNPSLFEGWSTPVEEARALGVPLVLSDLDVHREQAADSAHYFDRHSATSLAQALAAVSPISDDERERRLAVARVEAQARVVAAAWRVRRATLGMGSPKRKWRPRMTSGAK